MALQGDELNMKVMFRADASIDIGTGHVMRCLTLASALKEHGAECRFICRAHRGNLIQTIQGYGFEVISLPLLDNFDTDYSNDTGSLAHAGWLGASQKDDANACRLAIEEFQPDWLVVDHYGIDYRWQQQLKPYYRKLMVIDDLADRKHVADVLLDQTLDRNVTDYNDLVSGHCIVLCGTEYAILRPEFSEWRDYSLSRRQSPSLKRLLINLGGVDKDNVTAQLLTVLLQCENLPEDMEVIIVMGESSPWVDDIKALGSKLPWAVTVKVGVTNMAELMSECDLAIGAAGATSWERCVLGLPSIMVVLAKNQELVADQLGKRRAAKVVPLNNLVTDLPQLLGEVRKELSTYSSAAAMLCDGQGASKVVKRLMEYQNNE